MSRNQYSSDLTEQEWLLLKDLIPPARFGGRPRTVEIREILNAVFYVLRAGCAWRLLPHDFPHWRAVYEYFSVWKRDGTWIRIHDYLHEELRGKMVRQQQPSAAIVDSQSVKTTEKGGRSAVTMERRR